MSSAADIFSDNESIIEMWSDFLHIRSEEELNIALELYESLLDRKNAGEDHLISVLEILGDSIEKFERKYSIEKPAPVEMLKFLMVQHNHNQSDLADIAPGSVISNILHGKRELNINHVRKLCRKYKVSADLFL
ncbi:MAG: hypothetical protein JXR86_16035 [Spirochaetales bacterium]|nr:hypothetical protein [Spirochaetales bacterium]